SILDRHAHKLLQELPRVAQLSARVRELVAAELKNGSFTAEQIAQQLHVSGRTLHRRLKEENAIYYELVDDVRRGLTDRYLADPDMSLEQIALLVGYSEASAFRRAFRRWHGVSPARYRKAKSATAR
ncbi:MAG TPA: helix-turn-helix transcriptional regulator, partial [Polyangiaceae bacterium]|nr:helix-turn-helix transcriptional regulator [Polyangiaceae bacterium]